jgi:phage baseplate assembly protein W
MAHLAFPYRLDASGATATAVGSEHVSQMLEQLLFTAPGERVNHPDFGCGLLDLVFEPSSDALGAALTAVIGAAVQQWLGDVIELGRVDVEASEATLSITVSYVVRADGRPETARFDAGVSP